MKLPALSPAASRDTRSCVFSLTEWGDPGQGGADGSERSSVRPHGVTLRGRSWQRTRSCPQPACPHPSSRPQHRRSPHVLTRAHVPVPSWSLLSTSPQLCRRSASAPRRSGQVPVCPAAPPEPRQVGTQHLIQVGRKNSPPQCYPLPLSFDQKQMPGNEYLGIFLLPERIFC